MHPREQSRREEIVNSLSHGAALVAALVAAPFLVAAASRSSTVNAVGACVFALTMVLLFLASTLYHALPPGRGKRLFLKLDLSAIYLFIAGSYTPFALGALGGALDWTLFAVVWALALVGVTLTIIDRLRHPWWSTGLYLIMGWLVLFAAVPLVQHVPAPGTALLVAGGIAYTAGMVPFALDSRIRYAHAIWHGFVVVGTGLHYLAVIGYAGA